MEKMQCMGLQNLAKMEKTAQFGCGRGELIDAYKLIDGFGGC